ncbi:MAG: hypothetical protein M3069_21455 [Chloroflexota bacterium]|nr:hypothetical protein [Chloroflexota bacterium]
MARHLTRRDLEPRDITVLRDLVRFGVLANDQIERRYADTAHAASRLSRLIESGFVEAWSPLIQHTSVYSATAAATGVAGCGLRATHPSIQHLRHDIAVVDLADFLLEHEPQSAFRTEREVGRVLRGGRRPTTTWGPRSYAHRPDGLLLTLGKCLAIELEHTDKGDLRYAEICRWFALSVRVDGIRWYVDDPKTAARIRRVNEQHGYAEDVEVTYAPFPPGVAVRPWVRP